MNYGARAGRRQYAFAVFAVILAGTLAMPSTGRAGVEPEPFPIGWFLAGADTYAIRRLEGRQAPRLDTAEWAGTERSLHELRGKIVVIDFWAAWCPYCIPCLRIDAEIAREYADKGVEVLAIHDGVTFKEDVWKRIAAEQGVRFPHALDHPDPEKSTIERYKVSVFPTYVVIDRAGVVRAAGVRPDRVTDVIKRLLGEEHTPVKRSEFPPEFFVGRENRPSSLRRMEGHAAPPLHGDSWIGDEIEIRTGAEITLIQFFSPGNAKSLEALESLSEEQDDLASMGARIVAVAPPTCDWEDVKAIASERGWRFPVMRDQRTNSPEGEEAPAPITRSPRRRDAPPTRTRSDRCSQRSWSTEER